MSLINKAKEYLKAGLSVIPTKEKKAPALLTWTPYKSQLMSIDKVESLFNGAESGGVKPIGIAIICGAISGELEVIDVDTKHDTTGLLWTDLRTLIEDNLPEVYSKLVIAQTVSGGYHLYYKCSKIAGNLKLSVKLNKDVLVETRGEGGYVIAPPTKGYKYIQGEPDNIPTITPEERNILLNISKSFNELSEEEPKIKVTSGVTNYNSTGLSPFEDYNQRGDIIKLLESKGWKVGKERGQRINLLRPGSTDSKTSGNFHTGLRVLRVFSSSTEFNPDKGYSSSSVFSLLECNEDNKIAYRRLLELGYGEAFSREKINPTQIKTELIKVTGVNTINKETFVISTPGELLKIENIQTTKGEEIVIHSPGSEAREEVLKAIKLIEETSKKIYVVEDRVEMRSFKYILDAIFKKYGAIEARGEGLTDREIDQLQDEIIEAAAKLEPIDKDIFLKDFISQEGIKILGVTEESLAITVDRLTSNRDKEAQAKGLKKLLSEVTNLAEKGEVNKALDLMDSRVKAVKLEDKATEFKNLLVPITEEGLRERLINKPESLNSGYTIGGEELLLPAGAISILAAPTSHGKTTFLINMALNIAQAPEAKEVYLFSYEEDSDSILLNALNIYLNEPISGNNRTTLKNHFSGENQRTLPAGKDKFFKKLIATRKLNIIYTPYDSDTLIESIRYLHKNTNIGSVFIDYIQLLHKGEKGKNKYNSRQEEIKQICLDLKDLAVETGLPIILGAQFNREVVNPILIHATKIGEAGDIERIANLILGFWNNNFKAIASEKEINEITKKGGTQDTIYVTTLKNRGGRVGLEEILDFNGNTGKISNSSNITSYKDAI